MNNGRETECGGKVMCIHIPGGKSERRKSKMIRTESIFFLNEVVNQFLLRIIPLINEQTYHHL